MCKKMIAKAISAAILLFSIGTVQAEEWSYAEAAKPYAGTSIRVLDERSDQQVAAAPYIGMFEQETGIKVDYQTVNHFELLDYWKAENHKPLQNDIVAIHSGQFGKILGDDLIQPISPFMADKNLFNPNFNPSGLFSDLWKSTARHEDQYYGFLNWTYSHVLMSRKDLISHPDEMKSFERRYGYPLKPAETFEQLRDIAEFFTRKKGETLAGEKLRRAFYGIVMQGLGVDYLGYTVGNDFIKNSGGQVFDNKGRPTFDDKRNIAAVQFWADLWKFSPPQQRDFSLVEVVPVMGAGMAVQGLVFSDFVLGFDSETRSKLHGQFVYDTVPEFENSPVHIANLETAFLVIDKKSENSEAAYLFVQWLAEYETQAYLSSKTNGQITPNRAALWRMPSIKNSPFKNLIDANKKTMVRADLYPKTPHLMPALKILGEQLNRIATGAVSVEDGLKKAQAAALNLY